MALTRSILFLLLAAAVVVAASQTTIPLVAVVLAALFTLQLPYLYQAHHMQLRLELVAAVDWLELTMVLREQTPHLTF